MLNIQEELDSATDKEKDTLFNNLLYLDIDDFSYRGKNYHTLDLLQEQDSFLDLQSVLLSDNSIFLNGSLVKELN